MKWVLIVILNGNVSMLNMENHFLCEKTRARIEQEFHTEALTGEASFGMQRSDLRIFCWEKGV